MPETRSARRAEIKMNKIESGDIPESLRFAARNVVSYGDTDIFPYPFETRLLQDNENEVVNFFKEVDKNVESAMNSYPPLNINCCSTVGYYGYRWATQIDPLWNVYFLGLVLSLSSKIERQRLPSDYVYSYRISLDGDRCSIYDLNVNWRRFQQDSLDACAESESIQNVVVCDIADFYTRIYHHRLENALHRIDEHKTTSKKIMSLAQNFSGTTSYGLPVGGAASRILSELVLDSVDRLLKVNNIKFKRFVDDYVLFCESKEAAHSALAFLSRKLMENEGLTLQKHKTNIMSKDEFVNVTKARLQGIDEDEGSPMRAKFMSLPIRYDPYSANADEQYEAVKESLKGFDLQGMLTSELQKSKIDQSFSRQLIRALSASSDNELSASFKVIANSLNDLYPIYTTIMQVAVSNWLRMDEDSKQNMREAVRSLIDNDSFMLKTDINVAYLIKLISKDRSAENEAILSQLYGKYPDSVLVRHLVTQVMTKWGVHYWLSDQKKAFPTMAARQRRIFIIASYFLGDEGHHWRQHNRKNFSDLELIYRDWAAARVTTQDLADAL